MGAQEAANLAEHRQRLVDWIRQQLIGPAREGTLQGSLLERYPTAVLHPADIGISGIDPASLDDDEDHESNADTDADGEQMVAALVPKRRYVPPSSVGFSFLISRDTKLRITAYASTYRYAERDPTTGQFVQRYERGERREYPLVWPDEDRLTWKESSVDVGLEMNCT